MNLILVMLSSDNECIFETIQDIILHTYLIGSFMGKQFANLPQRNSKTLRRHSLYLQRLVYGCKAVCYSISPKYVL